MTLWDYFAKYMSELCEGTRRAPQGIVLTAADEAARAEELQGQIAALGVAEFVRRCAADEGLTLPDELFAAPQVEAEPEPESAPESEPQPDPDAGKHAFEVLADCVALEPELVQYLIEVLRTNDRAAFYKLSQVTTHLDLDPEEFLYWLTHREDYAESEDERVCAAVMDAALERLAREGQRELLAALLSGDQTTFELFRCDAPELRQLPAATFEWYAAHYLDRDYPLRFLLKFNGVPFPD